MIEWESKTNQYGKTDYWANVGPFAIWIRPFRDSAALLDISMRNSEDGNILVKEFDSAEMAMDAVTREVTGILHRWRSEVAAVLGLWFDSEE